MVITKPRGTNDFLPADTEKWQFIEANLRLLCREFGFGEIRTPIFEETDLFLRGVGDTTDIVQKEMYTFEDMGGRSLTLRPENTASAARCFVENKLYADTLPAKVFYMGPMFRYERPQAGRFRQFHQFGVEVFGSSSPATDAEVIALAMEFYRRLGLTNLHINLNSVGCPHCRPNYRKQLQDFLRPNLDKLCKTCQGRFDKNPMRIFDCKCPECQEIVKDAPVVLDCLCDECREHFEQVKQYLEVAGIPYEIDPHMVRGLDYYTKTAFEIIMEGIGSQTAICGGGRYDGLIEEVGGQPTPGVGFALGMERIFSALEQAGIELKVDNDMEVFVASFGGETEKMAFGIVQSLRKAGICAFKDDLGRSLKAQMKYANKFNPKFAIIVGEEELAKGEVVLRNMENSEQETLPILKAFSKVREILRPNEQIVTFE